MALRVLEWYDESQLPYSITETDGGRLKDDYGGSHTSLMARAEIMVYELHTAHVPFSEARTASILGPIPPTDQQIKRRN